MIPSNIERALRHSPRDGRWLALKGVTPSQLPKRTAVGRRFTDHGWHVVYYLAPRRLSKRWKLILATIHPDPSSEAQEPSQKVALP